MSLSTILSPAEQADHINAFVWHHDLPAEASRVVFGDQARAFYSDAEEGIRIRHVISYGNFLANLAEEDLPALGARPEDVRALTQYASKFGDFAIAEVSVVPEQLQRHLELVA